jgi:chromate transporter
MVVAPMKDGTGILATLAIQFAVLSLLAVGGANAVVPELHRQAVDIHGWMSARQFADMFVIAQVTPGPNVILVTLIGYHVAGLAGALVATAAMCGPTCLVAYFVGGTWERFKDARWRIAVQAGLVPVSIGLLGAGAILLARVADHNWIALAVTAATAAIAYGSRLSPLWMFAVGGLLGLIGLI